MAKEIEPGIGIEIMSMPLPQLLDKLESMIQAAQDAAEASKGHAMAARNAAAGEVDILRQEQAKALAALEVKVLKALGKLANQQTETADRLIELLNGIIAAKAAELTELNKLVARWNSGADS